MKRAYWFLLLFAVWCIMSGYWYMFGVKGIPSDLQYFNPHVRWIAILEIMIMLLVACLLGYAIGWQLRSDAVKTIQEIVQQHEIERETIAESKRELQERVQWTQQQLLQAQQSFAVKLNKAKQESDIQAKEVSDLQLQLINQNNSEGASDKFQQLESETASLRYRIKQVEFQHQESEETNRKLKHDLAESFANQTRKSSAEPLHPFVRPVEINEKDDLTRIKGIGPFIEKRLNMLGIYTFQQISEFTPDMIDHVNKAIEFFPHRIARDNWVGQATKLLS